LTVVEAVPAAPVVTSLAISIPLTNQILALIPGAVDDSFQQPELPQEEEDDAWSEMQ
jgi:hypothetical protein